MLDEPFSGLDPLSQEFFLGMGTHLPARLGADSLYSWAGGGELGIRGYEALARMVIAAVQAFQTHGPPGLEALTVQLREVAVPTAVEVVVRGKASRIDSAYRDSREH